MSAKMRKHQTTLICSGVAVIAFGLWSILRTMMMLIFRKSYFRELLAGNGDIPVELSTKILYITIFVMLILDLLFRLYAGMKAIREGSGKHRRITYIILSILYVAFFVSMDVFLFFDDYGRGVNIENIAGLIIDLTTQIAFIEIIVSSIALRLYEHRQRSGEGASHAA